MTFNIVANTALLCINWYGIDPRIQKWTEIANIVFIQIFTIAAILRLIALRLQYFVYGWNIFDLTIVVTS